MQAFATRLMQVQHQLKLMETVGLSPINQVLADHRDQLESVATLSALLGDEYDALSAEAGSLMTSMQALADQGIGPTDARMQALAERFREVQREAQLTQDQMQVAGDVASAVSATLAAALGSGVGEMAAIKAKQNAIMAAEQLAMALVSALNPATAPKAAAHLVAAGKFAAISAAWATLAGATGGFSSQSAGGTAGAGAGQAATQQVQPAGAEIHIHFVGPGFDAVNPMVQRVVQGAIREHTERAGNAVVKIHRKGATSGGGP
jgi:hypothetical protein